MSRKVSSVNVSLAFLKPEAIDQRFRVNCALSDGISANDALDCHGFRLRVRHAVFVFVSNYTLNCPRLSRLHASRNFRFHF